MRIGSFVLATQQGLGILAKGFYDHEVLTDALIIKHGKRPTHREWYPGIDEVKLGRLGAVDRLKEFASAMDAMLFFETPFDWDILPFCRSQGIRTVLMPMYECMPSIMPYEPDLYLCPSELDLVYFPNKSVYLPVPVEITWKQRYTAEVFVHNAGHLGLLERNGTRELLQSVSQIHSPIKLIINSQDKRVVAMAKDAGVENDPRIDIRIGTFDKEAMFNEGDVFIFPEKFNGLSLPLQEACANGMLVMATDRFPLNRWLPKRPLIPPHYYRSNRVSPRMKSFTEAVVSPTKIASTIDRWYGQDILEYSQFGREYAAANSWHALKNKYLEVIWS